MDLLEQLLEFEKEHKLFELQYKGVYYWHFIRHPVYLSIIYGEKASEAHPDTASKSLRDKLGFIPFIPNQIKQYLDKKQYDLFVSYAYVRQKVGDRIINPYIQFITDSYDFKVKTSTVFMGNWTNESTDISNNALIEALWAPLFIYSKVIQKIGLKDDPDLKRVLGLLSSHFSCNISYNKYLNYMQQAVLKYKLLKRYYLHCIKGKYKAIYFGCHYDLYNYALVAAAREAGISTIEHQHGAIGKYHIAYNFKDTSKVGKYLPDYLFTFGDYWSESCRLPDYVKAISVGSPQMDASKQEFENSIKDSKTIVFISDGIIGPEMSKFAVSFADMVVPLGYRIIYKFHPSECLTWQIRYPWLTESDNIETVDEPINVHSILSASQHIVSVASTVIFEALTFKCNVYIWDRQEKECVKDYVNMGFASPFYMKEQLFELVKNAKGVNDSDMANKLFKPESVTNIKEAFIKIMKEPKNEY